MALLGERSLYIAQEKREKFRVIHVGTKLSAEEYRAFEELLFKRNQRPAELIRDLILSELKREKKQHPAQLRADRSHRLPPDPGQSAQTDCHGEAYNRRGLR